MPIGVITDIHGNSTALDVVLADAATVGIDEWWVLGDLVAVGADPVGVVERLRSLPNATFVRGNTERYLTQTDFDKHGFNWTREQLGSERLAWLASLPLHARVDGTLLVHASPGRDDGPGLDARLTDDQLHVLVRGCEATRVFVGHTHRRVDRTIDGVRVVNPGSVGNPIESDLCAGWAAVDGDEIELRRVAYDRDLAIRRAEDSGNPVIDGVLAHLRGERIFDDQPMTMGVDEYEPSLEDKRA